VHGEQDVRTTAARAGGRSTMWENSQSVRWHLTPYYELNGRAARCGSARQWSWLPHGRTGRGWVGSAFKVAPLASAKRFAAPSLNHPAREPPLRPQQLHLCCQSNNTRRRCNRCLLPSYLTQLVPRPCHSFASSISTTSGPTTCDERPPKPTTTRIAVATVTPARLDCHSPFARGPLFRWHIPPPLTPPDKPIPTSHTPSITAIVHTRHRHQFTSRQPST
jgi:hypothetical protein